MTTQTQKSVNFDSWVHSPHPESLSLYGGAGRGKTFSTVSALIVRDELIARGENVGMESLRAYPLGLKTNQYMMPVVVENIEEWMRAGAPMSIAIVLDSLDTLQVGEDMEQVDEFFSTVEHALDTYGDKVTLLVTTQRDFAAVSDNDPLKKYLSKFPHIERTVTQDSVNVKDFVSTFHQDYLNIAREALKEV